MTTITIPADEYNALVKEFDQLKRSVRAFGKHLAKFAPAPETEATPATDDDLGIQAATLWPDILTIYRTASEKPIPTLSTRFEDGTFTVTVDAKYLEWLNRNRQTLQRMLRKRLPQSITLVFEANPVETTEADKSRSNGQSPGEGAGKPAETGESVEPESDGQPATATIITGQDGKKYSLQPRPANRRKGALVTDDAEMAKRAASKRVEDHAADGSGDSVTRYNRKADTEKNPALFLTAFAGKGGGT